MFPWLTGIPWRLVAAIGLGAVVAFAGWRVTAWHEAYKTLPGVQEALDAETECREGTECSKRQQAYAEAIGNEQARIVGSYEAELQSARSRPARVVRLCPDASSLRGTGAAAGDHGTGAAAGEFPRPTGTDIGPALYELARDADQVAARLRACQAWAKAVSTPPAPATD